MKVLVSYEADDAVGRQLLAGLPAIEVLPYDPTTDQLSPSRPPMC